MIFAYTCSNCKFVWDLWGDAGRLKGLRAEFYCAEARRGVSCLFSSRSSQDHLQLREAAYLQRRILNWWIIFKG